MQIEPVFESATAIISPEGQHVVEPLCEGEGMLIADLDMKLITKRKRMMDSVGHYARPELLSLHINDRPAQPMSGEAGTDAAAFGKAAVVSSYPVSERVYHESDCAC